MFNEQGRNFGVIAFKALDKPVFSLQEAARRRARKSGPSGSLGGIGTQIRCPQDRCCGTCGYHRGQESCATFRRDIHTS